MKKLLSIVLCLAMVLALGTVAFAEEAEPAAAPKIDFTNADNFTKESDDLGIWQANGIKLTVARPRAAANGSPIQPVAHTWTDHTRFLKGHQVTVEYPNMKSVKFTFIDAKRADHMANSICQYPGITVTVPEDKLTLTIDFAAPLNSFTIDFLVNIVRVTSVEIVATFQEGETAGTIQGPKTLTVADKAFTTIGGRWAYNQAVTSANNYMYDMVIYDTKYEGEFTTSSMYTNGVALIVDQEGVLTGMFTSASGAYYNADGEQKNYYASPTKWFQAAFDSLAEGEIMICFHNDGNKAGVDNYNKAMAELKDPAVYGQTVTLTGFFGEETCQHEFVDGICSICGEADPDYVAPMTDLVIGNNFLTEDTTYTYTAPTNGTLTLNINHASIFTTPGDVAEASYSINGGEFVSMTKGQNEEIVLNAGDVVTIEAIASGNTKLTAAWAETVAPVVEDKTITIGDKTFTTVDGKWAFNQEMTAANSTKYNMIIMTKAFTGSFATNGYGVAIVLDQYGTLVRVYDGANVGYWTVDGKAASAHFGANDYAITAWNELQEGETLVVFTHTGSEGNVARQFGLNVRSLCGKTAALTGFEFAAAPCKHTNTKVEGAVEATCEEKGHTGKTVCADCGETVDEGTEIAALGHNYVDGVCANCNNPKTFDVFGIMVAVMAASGTALVALKKKED